MCSGTELVPPPRPLTWEFPPLGLMLRPLPRRLRYPSADPAGRRAGYCELWQFRRAGETIEPDSVHCHSTASRAGRLIAPSGTVAD